MHKINHANIKEWAANYKGELFDGILCDPPYELGFMGKSWDSSGIAFDVEMWKDIYKLLKPGAHLLAFSGSRTYHRMAVAIEDAGFEIRDMIEWVYGSGFPKSLDISKAIDKKGGYPTLTIEVADALKKAREKRGITKTQADKMFCGGTTLYSWYEGRPAGIQLPTSEYMRNIADAWPELEKYVGLTMEAEREIVGTKTSGIANKDEGARYTIGASKSVEVDITIPKTANAQYWNGYGTALKPAHEPCVLARKPLDGTVANNVLKHGTGGLNIDGTRIPTTETWKNAAQDIRGGNLMGKAGRHPDLIKESNSLGRFPSNLILDGSDEVEAVFPSSKSTIDKNPIKRGSSQSWFTGDHVDRVQRGDSGSASRFFYTAKASRSERNSGLDGTVSIVVQLEQCVNNITSSVKLAQLQVVMDNSHLKATAESGIGTKSGTEWSMSWFGNQYTEKYLTSTKSTTKTETSSITPLIILNYLTGLLTNEYTAGVNCEMTVGGNHAENAENLKTLTLTINEKTASALGVENVQLPAQLKISVSDGKNFHSTVKPLSLTKYLATLIKPPTGGRLLVPFSGSGSEMIGALQAGWEYVEGVELTEEYIPIAEARIKYWLEEMKKEQAKPQQVSLI